MQPRVWQALLLLLLLLIGVAQAQDSEPGIPGIQNLCERDGRPYLIAEVNGGLNNQRWVLLQYMAAALKYDLVFTPGALHVEIMGECGGQQQWRPFHFLYSIDALVEFSARKGLKLALDVGQNLRDYCCRTLDANNAKNERPDVLQWLSQPPPPGQAVCLDYHYGFYMLPATYPTFKGWSSLGFSQFFLEEKAFDTFRPALQPSILLRSQVQYVLKELRNRYASGPHKRLNFTAVHVRNEDDFLGHCGAFAKPTKMRCFYDEAEVEAALRNRFHVPPGSIIQIASGKPLIEMPTLCNTFTCFNSVEIWGNGSQRNAFGECATREMKGAIEFWVAMHARAFFGNIHSSFSAELVAEFRQDGKPAEFVNEACKSDQLEACV